MSIKTKVPLDSLKMGMTCSQPVFGEDGVMLISGNTRITEQVVRRLRDRNISFLDIDPRDLRSSKTTSKRKRQSDPTEDAVWQRAVPLKSFLVDQYTEGLNQQLIKQVQRRYQQSKQQFSILEHRIRQQNLSSVVGIRDLTIDYAREMIQDHDQTVVAIGDLDDESWWAIRSTRLAITAMAIAIDLDFDGPQALEIGLAGMLHNTGLIAMDAIYRRPVSEMNSEQLWEYMKHPILTSRLIGQAVEVPHSISMAVEQIHEQYDGTGFPYSIRRRRIHQYARILNVAEAYVRLTSATPDHPALVPHDAMGFLLHQAAKGIFDPNAVRSLLNSQTLFPLGSHVELNDGTQCQVARRPREGYVNPVVIDETGKRMDLESVPLKIVRPIVSKQRSEIRLSVPEMCDRRWDSVVGLSYGSQHDAA